MALINPYPPLTPDEQDQVARMLRDAMFEDQVTDVRWPEVRRNWVGTTLKLFVADLRRSGFELIKRP